MQQQDRQDSTEREIKPQAVLGRDSSQAGLNVWQGTGLPWAFTGAEVIYSGGSNPPTAHIAPIVQWIGHDPSKVGMGVQVPLGAF